MLATSTLVLAGCPLDFPHDGLRDLGVEARDAETRDARDLGADEADGGVEDDDRGFVEDTGLHADAGDSGAIADANDLDAELDPDAVVLDAEPRDAGTGMDAEPDPDADSIDADFVDAEPTDADRVDATDASFPDAVIPDTGPLEREIIVDLDPAWSPPDAQPAIPFEPTDFDDDAGRRDVGSFDGFIEDARWDPDAEGMLPLDSGQPDALDDGRDSGGGPPSDASIEDVDPNGREDADQADGNEVDGGVDDSGLPNSGRDL